jgi:tetratricopeptide (TPR) repeat protein
MNGEDLEFSVAEVERLGAARLAALIVDHAGRESALARALQLALMAVGPVDLLATELAGRLRAVEEDRRFFDYRQSGTLADTLDGLRRAIVLDLLPREPRAAVALLVRLLRSDQGVFERCDDSDGFIGDVFRQTVADFGRAWLSVPDRDPVALAEMVFTLFSGNDYGVRDDIIPAVKDALGGSGLDEVERLIRDRFDPAAMAAGNRQQRDLGRALIEIADARGDLDGFIALHRLAGTEATAVKDICERLIAAGRLAEALERVERARIPAWQQADFDRLRVEILERLGRHDEAQSLRRDLFARTLSPSVLDDYLGWLPEADRPAAWAGAVDLARCHSDVHGALTLLLRLDPDAAAELVHRRANEFNPHLYRILRPAAERLAEVHPLAALLIYRCLADAVVSEGQSQFYDYAINDLKAAQSLAARVEDWRGHPTGETFRAQVAIKHNGKDIFWTQMHKAGLHWDS